MKNEIQANVASLACS